MFKIHNRNMIILACLLLSFHVVVGSVLPPKSNLNATFDSTNTFDLIILHNNDMHAKFEEINQIGAKCKPKDLIADHCYGGFPRVSTIVKRYRTAAESGGPKVLYLNAGDTYTGSPWFTLFKDEIASRAMNILKPDAASLGNHEFDLGTAGLIPFLNQVNFPVLVANLNISMNHPLWQTPTLKRSAVLNVTGLSIGVIGYLLPDTKHKSSASDIDFLPEISAINEEAAHLKSQGVKTIIALGHSGYEKDQEIAKNCPLVDIVVGGHSHTFLCNGIEPDIEKSQGPYPTIVKQASGKEVPVVQAFAHTKYMGKLELSFDENGKLVRWYGKPIVLHSKIPKDPQVLRLLDEYQSIIIEVSKQIIGSTKTSLDHKCHLGECNLGNFVTDAAVFNRAKQYKGPYWTDASIAIVNGGGIRAAIPVGNISKYDLLSVLPFENRLLLLNVTGHVLKLALETSVQAYGHDSEFLQVSGLRVVYNMMNEPGQRVESVKVLCQKCEIPKYEMLDINEEYGIIIDSYNYGGGCQFDMYKLFRTLEMNMTLAEATMRYIAQLNIIYPKIEGRIIVKNTNRTASVSSPSTLSVGPSYSLLFSSSIVMFFIRSFNQSY